ncbi:MAG: hypothetical protein ACLQHS_17450, partial [Candidatus Limnocylindrales bacterium]
MSLPRSVRQYGEDRSGCRASRFIPGGRYSARMLLGIDHLVIAVPDPDAAAAQLERELDLA